MNTSNQRLDLPFLPSDLAVDKSLVRAAFARVHARAIGGLDDDAAVCKRLFPNDKVASAIIAKADQTIGTTTGAGWAAELIQQSTLAFLNTDTP